MPFHISYFGALCHKIYSSALVYGLTQLSNSLIDLTEAFRNINVVRSKGQEPKKVLIIKGQKLKLVNLSEPLSKKKKNHFRMKFFKQSADLLNRKIETIEPVELFFSVFSHDLGPIL